MKYYPGSRGSFPRQGSDLYIQQRAQTRSETLPASHSIEIESLAAVASS
jgi:hypothetical protein